MRFQNNHAVGIEDNDKLSANKLNALPHPLTAKMHDGALWPIHDIETQVAWVRIDVCGMLQVIDYIDISDIVDDSGTSHDSDTFWTDYEEDLT